MKRLDWAKGMIADRGWNVDRALAKAYDIGVRAEVTQNVYFGIGIPRVLRHLIEAELRQTEVMQEAERDERRR